MYSYVVEVGWLYQSEQFLRTHDTATAAVKQMDSKADRPISG